MHPIAQKIASLQRQLAYRQFATAACWSVAAILATALALGLVDYVVQFRDPGLRVMATTALAGVAVWAVYRWWYLPSRKRLRPLAVARKVESHFPQLNDSLASALEFLQQSEDDCAAGSAQLRRLVVAEAEMAVESLPLDEVIDRRPLHRASIWLAAAGVVLVACLAWDASAVRTAFSRLAAPFGATQWPRQHHLAFQNPPSRLAAGQTFEAELINSTGSLPEEVRVEYRFSHGTRGERVSEPMTRVGDVMIARRENVRQSFSFRATGGDDDVMPWQEVEVIEPPQLKSLEITVHPPAYTGLPSAAAERHLEVLAGTGIEISGVAAEALGGARVLQDGEPPINATITPSGSEPESSAFRISPEKWIAKKSGTYGLELADRDGLAGTVGQWNLRVEPDSPPNVSWQSPGEDLYVTPSAVIPIEVVVKDNLAIQSVHLMYDRSDWSEAERERVAPSARIEMHRGPNKTAMRATEDGVSTRGESRTVEYSWDLAELELPIGAEISIVAEATDYRPGVGRTVGPRRLSIVSPEELETRLAERQTQIARQLERALAIEQSTREEVRRVEIQLQDAGSLTSGDRNALQSAELNQRRVARILIDPTEGVPALVEALLRDLEINRIVESDLHDTLGRLSAELSRLSAGPLEVADRELTASRKSLDTAESLADGAFSRFLASAGAEQDEVIVTLERLVAELSGKADYRRFARLVAELREDQMAHEEATRAEIGVETLPLRLSDLTSLQQTSLNKAAAGQTAIAARLEKIELGMELLGQELTQSKSEGGEALTDAVELARSLAIGGKMDETARDLAENRLGAALDREKQIADDLQQVLAVLRGESERRPEQLADKLREAEKQLDALRQELTALREQIAQTEKQSANAATPQQLQSLSQKQQDLRNQIEQLARQLNRLQAEDASQSTKNAAERLDSKPPNANHSPANKRPSSSQQVQEAEQDLDDASKKLAARRQQAEDDLALEIVRRFQAQLTDMVERQKKVLDDTIKLHGGRQPGQPLAENDVARIRKLEAEESELAEMAKEHSELLVGLGAVRVSLEEAERRLVASARLLNQRETGTSAQDAERHALARLEDMMEAFAQTANEAQQNQPPPPDAGQGAAGEQPQRRPTFELLEVKMLRMLQVDLQERTREYQQRLAGLEAPPDQKVRASLEREARELAADQGRLAELVENMLTRDNKKGDD